MLCHQMKSHFIKRREQGTVQGIILNMNQLMSSGTDLFQLLFGSHSRDICLMISCVYLIFQGSHTHHKEFIQVGSCNT